MKKLPIIAAAMSLPVAAFAQDTAVTFEPLVDFVLPIILTVVSGMIAIGLPIVFAKWEKVARVKIEAGQRDAFQQSLTNTAGRLIREMGDAAKAAKVNVHDPRMRDLVKRAIAGAPDMVRAAGLPEEEISARILEKVALEAYGRSKTAPTPIVDALS